MSEEQEKTVLKARFVVIGEHHQMGQFQKKQPKDAKNNQPPQLDLEPIVSVKLVAQSKTEGDQHINDPTWRETPAGLIEINHARTAALVGFKPGQEYILTLEPVEVEAATVN